MITKIISGAQTGVDRIALDTAILLGINYGGYVPKGRRSEDGTIPDLYTNLIETESEGYLIRTEQNIIHSDATLIITPNAIRGGTEATLQLCGKLRKPFKLVYYREGKFSLASSIVAQFLYEREVEVLNVAGPRMSRIDNPKHFSKVLTQYLSDVTSSLKKEKIVSFGL